MPARRSNLRALAIAALLVGGVAQGGDPPVPWPHGEPPAGSDLDEIVNTAVELGDLERYEEFLDAAEVGEDSEHMLVWQDDIDLGMHSKEFLFRRGDAFFSHEFRSENGYGTSAQSALSRVHTGVRGGLDSFSCAGCHSLGGPDGAGSETQNAFVLGDGDRLSSANVRNAPMALGLGFVQSLAVEMSADLAKIRTKALEEAAASQKPVTAPLSSKGVEFGSLTALPSGEVDTSGVEGVSEDLIVRPFGWKGNVARLRRFVEEAARVHFGVQSHVLALGYKENPELEKLGPGPDWWDPDHDGIQRELEEGSLTAAAVYLAMLETPVVLPPNDPGLRDRWSEGEALFEAIGCSSCHRRELPLFEYYWTERPDTTSGPGVLLHLIGDGDKPRGSGLVKLFSDLKRHDMGPELADPHPGDDGIPQSVFLTRPLWGLAESAPYLHDGRAATIPEAILAHGGEAKKARDAFAELPPDDQANVHMFLLSLTREPKVRVAQ
ncbi:MAG TPA: di-heme oxidoredictase family protein [Polyangiaceae bacterium]|nr:di-heme oxidoredictase family protein [Polyangiaceae bacterium]